MDAVITVDQAQNIVLFNRAAEQTFRCPRREALGAPLDRFLPARYRAVHRGHIEHFARTGVTSRRMGDVTTLWGLRADGQEFPIEATISQAGAAGERYYTVILRDVTLRKQAEADAERARGALDEAQRRLGAIVDSAMDAVITVDDEQKIALFNRAAEQVFGVRREEMLGTPLDRLLPARFRGAHRGHIEGFGRTGVTNRRMGDVTTLWALRPGSGEEFPIEASISQAAQEGRRFYTVILRDITVRKQAEDALKESQRELRELSARVLEAREEEKAHIARELHDELGQLLTALKMDLGWLRERLPQDAAMTSRVNEMSGLLDRTVSATRRISADLRPLMLDDLGLADAAAWLVDDFAKRSGVACRIDVAEALPDISKSVATAVYRAVQESLTNIARHAGAKKRLGGARGGGRRAPCRGRGRRPRHRARGPRQEPLAGSQGHARAHRVPRRHAGDHARAARRHAAAAHGTAARLGAGERGLIRVLIADDHSIVRDGLKRILAATTDLQAAAEAASGDEALALVKANDYDVVMLDMSMPGLAGIDLIKRLKLEKPKLRILVLSMHGESQYAARVLKAGAAGYLSKDSAAELLLERAAQDRGRRRAHRRCRSRRPAPSRRKTAPRNPVGPRVRGHAPAGRGPRPDRDRRAAAPLGEDCQHPQDPHSRKAQPRQHRGARALCTRAPPGLGIFLSVIAASDYRPASGAGILWRVKVFLVEDAPLLRERLEAILSIPGTRVSGTPTARRKRCAPSSPSAPTWWCWTSTSPTATASTCCAGCARRISRRKSMCSPIIRSTATARPPSGWARAASSTRAPSSTPCARRSPRARRPPLPPNRKAPTPIISRRR